MSAILCSAAIPPKRGRETWWCLLGLKTEWCGGGEKLGESRTDMVITILRHSTLVVPVNSQLTHRTPDPVPPNEVRTSDRQMHVHSFMPWARKAWTRTSMDSSNFARSLTQRRELAVSPRSVGLLFYVRGLLVLVKGWNGDTNVVETRWIEGWVWLPYCEVLLWTWKIWLDLNTYVVHANRIGEIVVSWL